MKIRILFVILLYFFENNFCACENGENEVKLQKSNKNHPQRVNFLRLRTFSSKYEKICPKSTTKEELKTRVLDSIAKTHNFTNVCAISKDSTGLIIQDRTPGYAQIFARCPAIPVDQTFWHLIANYRNCNILRMRQAWSQFSLDVKILAKDNWQKFSQYHLDWYCVNTRLINMNCPEKIRPALFHESVIYTINQLTGLELEETEIPYTGINLILKSAKEANKFLLRSKMSYFIVALIIFVAWLLPVKRWSGEQEGNVAVIAGFYTKCVECVTAPFHIIIAKLTCTKINRTFKGYFNYLLDKKSWINDVTNEGKNLVKLRSLTYDTFSRLSTTLARMERELFIGKKISMDVDINTTTLNNLGVTTENDNDNPVWMKSKGHQLTGFATSLITMITVQVLAFVIVNRMLGVSFEEGYGLIMETMTDRIVDFKTTINDFE